MMTPIITPAKIAEHKDVIAVFVFNCVFRPAIGVGETENGSHAEQWRGPALSFVHTCIDAIAERAVLHLGDDAQVLRFARDDERALVVVTVAGTPLTKSLRRMMRMCLQGLAKAAKRERSEVAP